MEHKNIYTAIAIAFGVVFLYTLFNIVQVIVNSYQFAPQYLLFLIPQIVGITGLLIFVTSGYKKSGLLRLFMCYELFNAPFIIFYYFDMLFTKNENINSYSLSWQFYVGVFLNIVIITASAIGLWFIGKRRLAKISYFGQGESKVGQFVPASSGLRFANRIIDGTIISFTVLGTIGRLLTTKMSSFNEDDLLDSPGFFYVITIPALIIYYLLLEGIFNTTAGKCATNTTIVNDSGEKPGFAKILGRTFCRLIPFEPFSFFDAGARGWHDSIPNTYVVESIDVDNVADNEITLDAELNLQ